MIRKTKTFPTVSDIVGQTPIVRLQRITDNLDVEMLLKLEFLNPGGSTKDRSFIAILNEAEKKGDLKPGATIIDSSSGNFAIAMAMVGAAKGYRVICIVDPKLTTVAKNIILSLGGKLEYATEADESGIYLKHRLTLRNKLLKTIAGSWCPDQYSNKASINAHYWGTGSEIISRINGHLDVLVIPIGTGGTISGCAKMVKEHIPNVQIVAVDAVGSKIFSDEINLRLQKGLGSSLSFHELENLDLEVIDEVYIIGDNEAFMTARTLVRNEGILAGGSSGSALFAALMISRKLKPGSRILTILPDRMERYLYEYQNDKWMVKNGFNPDTTCEGLWKAIHSWHENMYTVQGPKEILIFKSKVFNKDN